VFYYTDKTSKKQVFFKICENTTVVETPIDSFSAVWYNFGANIVMLWFTEIAANKSITKFLARTTYYNIKIRCFLITHEK
jgi:hypothetical protein